MNTFFTVEECAVFLGIAPSDVERLIAEEQLWAYGDGAEQRIPRLQAELYKQGQTSSAIGEYPLPFSDARCIQCGAPAAVVDSLCPLCARILELPAEQRTGIWFVAQGSMQDRRSWLEGRANPSRFVESRPTWEEACEESRRLNLEMTLPTLFFYFVMTRPSQ